MSIIVTDRREPPPLEALSDIYIDESSQTKNRYLLIGGIIVPTILVPEAAARLQASRLPELPHGEMKWGKASRSKLAAYKRFVDCFFDDPAFARSDFHCLVVDTTLVDHDAYNAGSKEIGFNKEIYQIATKFARLYRATLFHLYPDYRDTKQKPDDLRNILNHGWHKRGDGRDWPFRRCQFRDSSQVLFLQLVDIMLGAVAFGKNEHHARPGVSEPKLELGRHVMRRAGIRDLSVDTAMSGKFTVWHRQLQPKAGVPRA